MHTHQHLSIGTVHQDQRPIEPRQPEIAHPGARVALPLHLERKSGGRVEVFGAVRSASSGDVEVEFKATRRASYRSLGSIAVNNVGYFRRTFRVNAFSGAIFRVTLGDNSEDRS